MTATSSLLRKYFEPLKNLPCWDVTAEYGSWLSLHFGQPHLKIRERDSESKLKSMRRRAVFVESEFLLWVEMGAWDLFDEGKRAFHSEQSRGYLRRAAARLDAQQISRVELMADTVSTVWTFDLGGQLIVRPTESAKPDEPLWHIYGKDRCLSLLANGVLEHGSLDRNCAYRTTVRDAVYVA